MITQLLAATFRHVAKEYLVLNFVPGVPATDAPVAGPTVTSAVPVLRRENDDPTGKLKMLSDGTMIDVATEALTTSTP